MFKDRLSDCELDVMKILWEFGSEMSQPQIKAILEQKKEREYGRTTIATWMSRLKKNQYVDSVVRDKTTYFYPRITEAEYEELELKYFAKRLFHGSFAKAIMAFAKSENLTEEDEKEIREMLDDWNR